MVGKEELECFMSVGKAEVGVKLPVFVWRK